MLLQIAINTLLAFIIFFVVNTMGGLTLKFGYTEMHYRYKREDNFGFDLAFKIFTPILIAIAFALIMHFLRLPDFYKHIWTAVVGSWLIRVLYILAWNRYSLMNWWIFFVQAVISSLIAYWLHHKLIISPALLFPSRDNMVSEVWLIVVLFLYKAMADINPREIRSQSRKAQYLESTFNHIRSRFGKLISKEAQCPEIEILTYSIIIHENFNRPKVVRTLENILSRIKKNGTYGIMQVKSTKMLSDKNSIIHGVHILTELFNKVKTITEEKNPGYKYPQYLTDLIIKRTAWHYNNSENYSEEIALIYDLLRKKHYSLPKVVNPEDRFNALYHSESL